MKIIPTILAGGVGTRLWPRSRAARPKQFLDVGSERSLLVQTVARFCDDARFSAPIIAGAAEHGFMVARDLAAAGILPKVMIAEPEKRNTAPAIAAASRIAADRYGPDAILCIMPADQVVRDVGSLRQALIDAAAAAAGGAIVTVGITPTEPATGYGYLEMGEVLPDHLNVRKLKRFVEKPDRATAEGFVASGQFLWNAGMFVARADILLSELAEFCPDVLAAVDAAIAGASEKAGTVTLGREAFAQSPSISFDYAVMEATRRAAVVPADIGWTDVGSWSALWELLDKDGEGNAIKGDVLAEDCRNSHIESEGRLLVGLGLDRMLVVQTRDATLVAPLDRSQDIGKLVASLKQQGRAEVDFHTQVHRPWGWFDSLWQAAGYQVKHLMVAPGASISLQLHHHRSEHWVVLRGQARVTRGQDVFMLEPGQSTFIPVETRHRLENQGPEELHVVEVQLGDYLGEDDIVRFEDIYDRV